MAGCCGPTCSKVFVILYNIIFWISGCAFLALGVILLYDKSYKFMYLLLIQDPAKYPDDIVDYVAYGSIGIGGLLLFAGFFGCCGALQESKCMVGTYIFFLIVICFVEAALGLGTFYFYWTFPETAKGQLKNQWTHKYTHEVAFTNAFNHAQYSMKCCGIESANDYNNNPKSMAYDSQNGRSFDLPDGYTYPLTCCIPKSVGYEEEPWQKPAPLNFANCQKHDNYPPNGDSRYERGCYDEIVHWLWCYVIIVGASSGGLAVLQILGVLFSLCLIRNVGEEA